MGDELLMRAAEVLAKVQLDQKEAAERERSGRKKQGRPRVERSEVEFETFEASLDLLGRPDMRADAEWIYQNMDVANPMNPPSAGAKSFLNFVKRTEQTRRDFYMNVVVKFLPTRAQLDQEEERKDDGRVLTLLDGLLHEQAQGLLQSGAEGLSREPEVSEADDPEGYG